MSHTRFTMAAIALFSASEQTHSALVVCDSGMSDCNFTQLVFEYPPKWLRRCFVVIWLVPRETAAACVSLQCQTVVHVCLAVTRHLHCWQNGGRDPLRATAATRTLITWVEWIPPTELQVSGALYSSRAKYALQCFDQAHLQAPSTLFCVFNKLNHFSSLDSPHKEALS